MKLFFLLTVLSVGCGATLFQNIKSPADSPEFKQTMRKLFLESGDEYQNITGRITNGAFAQLGEFPYQVYLLMYWPDGSASICGGSIIDRRWVLTAAHCVNRFVKIEIYFGAINIFRDNSEGSYVKMIVVTRKPSMIPHEYYNSDTKANDIGLLELPEDAPLEHPLVATLPLPRGVDATRNLVGVQATVSGFGQYSDDIDSISSLLRFIRLPIASNTVCSSYFGSIYVSASNICLQSVNRGSACSGDSGGPLTIVGQNNLPVIVGLVSYGASAGCEKGYPQGFTRVSSFVPWIEVTTGIKFT